MLDPQKLERLTDRIYRAYDLLDSYEALDTDKISEYTKPEQLRETLWDLGEALQALNEAHEIGIQLMREGR